MLSLKSLKKTFRPYIIKLRIESVLKALAVALAAGLAAAAFIILYTKLMRDEPEYMVALTAGCSIFLLGSILFYFVRYKPGLKDTAARIDKLGLEERISTMLALADDESVISNMQRQDALEKLSRTEPKQVKILLPRKQLRMCCVLTLIIAGLILIPFGNAFADDTESGLNEEENRIISELINDLREEVAQVDVDDETRASLNEVIDELEADIEDCDTFVEKIARISEASDQINEILNGLLTKNIIGAALTDYDRTEELGRAIIDGDTDAVIDILEDMKNELSLLAGDDYQAALSEIIDSIDGALALSESAGVDAEDELFGAINTLGDKLTDALADAQQGEDVSDRVEDAINEAEEAITSALEKQNQIEEAASNIQDLLGDAKDELTSLEQGEEPEESMSSEASPPPEGEGEPGEEGQPPEEEGEPGEEGQPPDDEGQPGGDGGPAEQTETQIENIYDPADGTVPYNEVYGSYYSDALSDLAQSDLPDNVKDSINDYFESIG